MSRDGTCPLAARARGTAADGRRFILDWTTEGHTGVPTPVTAQRPGAQRLAGQYPNVHPHEVMGTALLGG
jgi:alkaline phosphatase